MSLLTSNYVTVEESTYSSTTKLTTEALTIPTGAASGLVLTSDSFGNASWQQSALAGPATSTQYSIPTFADSTGKTLLNNSTVQISPSGVLSTAALKITASPVAGYVLMSDSSGNGTWQATGGPGPSTPAYGYAAGTDTSTIAGGAFIPFSVGATTFPNIGFTSVPAAAGTSFVVASTGVYEFNFYVAANDAAGTTLIIEVGLDVGGTVSAGYSFRSALATSANAEMVCVGNGLISLTATNVVSLKNITNASATAITFTSMTSGSTTIENRSLTLRRIA